MRIPSLRLLSLLSMFSQLPAEPLSDGWEYRQGDLGGPYEALRTDPLHNLGMEWQAVSLPHCFNETDAVAPDVRYYQGPGWYRKTLRIDNPYKDGRTFLRFDGAGQKTRLYVEDIFIGGHVGGYDEFQFDITEAVHKHADGEGKVNLLVRCDNSRDLQMIPSDLSDFNLYGGLYRPVHLLYRPAVRVSWPVIDVAVDEEGLKGEIRFDLEAMNPLGQKGALNVGLTVEDPGGKIVAEVKTTRSLADEKMTSLGASVSRPLLWSPSAPNLYRWTLTAQGPDGEVHTQQGNLGFRHFRFEKKGPFFLNGERLLLRGTHRHEDHAGVAAAMTEAQMRREMELMKSMGVNFIRLGHYQQSRTILELCNELGILVWEEIPWCRGGLGGDAFKEQARRMLRNMIAQHRHHPSVILWGLGNENDWSGDFEVEFGEVEIAAIRGFMKELHDLSHELDPSRLTAIRRCDFCADIVDVYSPSIWAGWYRGIYRDYKEISRQQMEKVDHFLHVEWGASHHAGRHSEDPYAGIGLVNPGDADERAGDFLQVGGEARVSKDGDWSETYACDLIDWHLKKRETMPWLTGVAYWAFKDFSTPIRPENPVPFMNQKGVVERDLTPKESFYVFQSYWTEDPMIRIYGHSWPVRWGKKDEPKVVKVYANCGSVELFLNGKSIDTRQRDSQDFPAAGLRWLTPFREGVNTLRAVGKRGDSVVEDQLEFEYQTKTWSEPAKLDFKVIAETKETATVQVYALDANGVRCLDARNFVYFDLTGDGRLIAAAPSSDAPKPVRFTSVPDIFNWNISNPQPGWEETLDWFFDRLHEEGPDFHLNAGDIMDARWWDNPEQVKTKTEEYWPGFLQRYAERGMTLYLAPGDHEYGDDGGLERGDIARAFGTQFSKMMGMPKNGPASNLGRAFWVRKNNLLIVSLDTFVDRGDHFGYTVGVEKLEWFDKVLTEQGSADFVIVQGHLPIIGPVRSQNSSGSMLEDGTESELWKIMVKHKVDVYLTDEHHRITVSKQDGIWQIVHGALWGTQPDLNYLRGEVSADGLKLELVEFDVTYSGGFIGDHPHRSERNRPRENVSLSDHTKAYGPRTSGILTIQRDSDDSKKIGQATGWFGR